MLIFTENPFLNIAIEDWVKKLPECLGVWRHRHHIDIFGTCCLIHAKTRAGSSLVFDLASTKAVENNVKSTAIAIFQKYEQVNQAVLSHTTKAEHCKEKRKIEKG